MIFQEGENVKNITMGSSTVTTGATNEDHLVETEPHLAESPPRQLTRKVKANVDARFYPRQRQQRVNK